MHSSFHQGHGDFSFYHSHFIFGVSAIIGCYFNSQFLRIVRFKLNQSTMNFWAIILGRLGKALQYLTIQHINQGNLKRNIQDVCRFVGYASCALILVWSFWVARNYIGPFFCSNIYPRLILFHQIDAKKKCIILKH